MTELHTHTHCINVTFLVLILYFNYVRCNYYWGTPGEGCMGSLYVFLCNFLWTYNYFKIKHLKKVLADLQEQNRLLKLKAKKLCTSLNLHLEVWKMNSNKCFFLVWKTTGSHELIHWFTFYKILWKHLGWAEVKENLVYDVWMDSHWASTFYNAFPKWSVSSTLQLLGRAVTLKSFGGSI